MIKPVKKPKIETTRRQIKFKIPKLNYDPFTFFVKDINNHRVFFNIEKYGSTKVMNINHLEKIKPTGVSGITGAYDYLVRYAKQQNCRFLYTKSWLFYEHPELAKKLGFVAKDTEIKRFQSFLNRNLVSKILGIEMKTTKTQKTIFTNLKVLTIDNKEKIITGKIPLPTYILGLK